jgi:hypothetical protein
MLRKDAKGTQMKSFSAIISSGFKSDMHINRLGRHCNSMRHLIASFGLMLLTSCASTVGTRPFTSDEPRVYVQGTYAPGSNLTLPRPRQSRFFRVQDAGFLVLKNKGAAYYLRAHVPEPRTTTYFVRIEYDNPQDTSYPFVNGLDLKPDMGGVLFTSPDVVWGIRNYQTYSIRVSVFADGHSKQPIDTLVQPFRAYVDTTTTEVRIYKSIR